MTAPTGTYHANLGRFIETRQGLSRGAKIAIGVAIPVGIGIAVVCIVMFFGGVIRSVVAYSQILGNKCSQRNCQEWEH
jgi:hypothetical protein